MRTPDDLSRPELVSIVTGLLRILYGQQQADGTWTYDPGKQ